MKHSARSIVMWTNGSMTVMFVAMIVGVRAIYDCEVLNVEKHTDCSDIDGCRSCGDPPLICRKCAAGYALHANEVTCQACGAYCLECSADISITCTRCITGYYPNTQGDCERCPASCPNCTSSSGCDVCEEGYTTAANANGAECKSCSHNCVRCATSSLCLECRDGTYLHNGQCQDCASNCEICTVGGNCVQCAERYRLVQGYCLPCLVDRCLSCLETVDGCVSCEAGYYPHTVGLQTTPASCEACQSGCLSCSDASSCDQCYTGYYYDTQQRACTSCSSGCEVCSSSQSCDQCESGTYLDDSHACQGCGIQNCVTCSVAGGTVICDVCVQGMYYESALSACTACPAALSCVSCASATQCTSCVDGSYLHQTDMNCQDCPDNCLLCTSETACTQCVDTHCWDSNLAQCVELPYTSTCTLCSVEGDKVNCLDCAGDTAVQNMYQEICQPCEVSYCAVCDGDVSQCERCQQGRYHFVSGAEQSCRLCPGAPRCMTCDSSLECTQCSDGYYGAMCEACPSGCRACTTDDSCEECVRSNAYYDSEENACIVCSSGCAQCFSAKSCVECLPGYELDGSSCTFLVCDPRCSVCEATAQGTRCVQCEEGFFLNSDDDHCVACSLSFPDCGLCTDINEDNLITAGECSRCTDGYLSDDTTECLPCGISNCARCENAQKVCCECEFAHAVVDGQCVYDGNKCYDQTCTDGDIIQGKNCSEAHHMDDVASCSGLGISQSCWSVRTTTATGLVTHSRLCRNTTCDDVTRVHTCTLTRGSVLECSICCDTTYCNNHTVHTIVGLALSTAAHHSCVTWTVLLMLLLYVFL